MGCSSLGQARLTDGLTYQEMFDKAELVVIARVAQSKDTPERSRLLDLEVVGVTTEFTTRLTLKGDPSVKKFDLHHYRLASDRDENVANGPNLVFFRFPHPPFLLFLVKEKDGRYAPVGGQTDPAGLSVLELGGGAD
jgi:hypothetical protein